MPLLHVNADDFGLHADIDRGIVQAVDAGRVTGVSVAVNGSAIDWHAVRLLARRVQVGVHVTLVGEPWLTSARLFDSWTSLLPWLALPGRSKILIAEMRAQVRRMIDEGIVPLHLDSHQHVHVMPRVWDVAVRVAAEHGIPRVRVPAAPDRKIAKQSLSGRALQRLAESRRRGDPLPCIGLAFAGHNTAERLIGELEASRGADVELVAHPGLNTPALQARYSAWKFDWKTEQAALLSDAWGAAVARLGYRFGPPARSGSRSS